MDEVKEGYKRIKRMHLGREIIKEVPAFNADRLIGAGWEEVKPKKRKAVKKTDKAETATKKTGEGR